MNPTSVLVILLCLLVFGVIIWFGVRLTKMENKKSTSNLDNQIINQLRDDSSLYFKEITNLKLDLKECKSEINKQKMKIQLLQEGKKIPKENNFSRLYAETFEGRRKINEDILKNISEKGFYLAKIHSKDAPYLLDRAKECNVKALVIPTEDCFTIYLKALDDDLFD